MNLIDNRYYLIREIGIGGMATVYKAWDNTLEKFVAIKKIHDEFTSDAKFVDLFKAEALNTAKLEHENIVRVINFIKDSSNSSLFMVMDYVNGINLSFFIRKCINKEMSIPYDFTLYVCLKIIKALDYAFSVEDEVTGRPLRMVHRDISPANVMIYFDGRIKLTDFGIAKVGDQQAHSSEKGKLRGKLSYMSPEQARGEITIDSRSDLFSCGLIMYEMIAGLPAYGGIGEETVDGDDIEVLQKIKSAHIDFSKVKKSEVPKEIQNILKKTLQKSPQKRYQSTIEMFIEIRKYLSKIGKTYELDKKYTSFIQRFLEEERLVSEKERMQELEDRLKRESIYPNMGAETEKAAPVPIKSVVSEPAPVIEKKVYEETQEPTREELKKLFDMKKGKITEAPDEVSKNIVEPVIDVSEEKEEKKRAGLEIEPLGSAGIQPAAENKIDIESLHKKKEEFTKFKILADGLLEKLTEEDINAFSVTEEFKTYEKVMNEEETSEENISKFVRIVDDMLSKLPDEEVKIFAASTQLSLYEKFINKEESS